VKYFHKIFFYFGLCVLVSCGGGGGSGSSSSTRTSSSGSSSSAPLDTVQIIEQPQVLKTHVSGSVEISDVDSNYEVALFDASLNQRLTPFRNIDAKKSFRFGFKNLKSGKFQVIAKPKASKGMTYVSSLCDVSQGETTSCSISKTATLAYFLNRFIHSKKYKGSQKRYLIEKFLKLFEDPATIDQAFQKLEQNMRDGKKGKISELEAIHRRLAAYFAAVD